MATKSDKTPRKISIVASKGSLDMAYPPLIIANAARMSGIEVNMFFTFWGQDMITKKKMNKLNVSVIGNPAMHPWFHIPTLMGLIPGLSAAATWMMRREIAKLDFPPVGEFIQLLLDSGAHLYGCKATMDMMKLKKEDLVDGAGIATAMEFVEMAEGGQIIFV
jgi:peroxiredoxin family protein